MEKRPLWEQVFWHGLALTAGTLTLLGLVKACEADESASRPAVADLIADTAP